MLPALLIAVQATPAHPLKPPPLPTPSVIDATPEAQPVRVAPVSVPRSTAQPAAAPITAPPARVAPPVPAAVSRTATTPDAVRPRAVPAQTNPAKPAAAGSASAVVPREAMAKPRPTRAQVEAAVRSEWPRYDTGGTGKLNPLQFSTWVMRANGATVKPAGATPKDPGIKPVRAMNATARAFATADADHDGGVTRGEMVSFLLR